MENDIESLKESMENCDWKSVLLKSDCIMRNDPFNIDALIGRSIALYSTKKYAELEQWLESIPENNFSNQYLLAIRCKALQEIKDFKQILNLLGGQEAYAFQPLASAEDVDASPILKPIRDYALFMMEETYKLPRMFQHNGSTPDPMSVEAVSKDITQAVSKMDATILYKYTTISDHSTASDAIILTSCGCYNYLNGNIESGKAFIIKATQIDPNLEIAWLLYLLILTYNYEYDHAISTIKKIHRSFPNSQNLMMFAATLYLKTKSIQLSRPWINDFFRKDPSDLFMIHEQSVAYFYGHNIAQAFKGFEYTIEKCEEKVLLGSSFLHKGHCLRRMGKFEEALVSYRESLGTDTCSVEALASIGFTYHLLFDYDNAIISYNECLAINNVHPFATKMLDIALKNSKYGS